MMDKVAWPKLKRGLVAILRGITPPEAEAPPMKQAAMASISNSIPA